MERRKKQEQKVCLKQLVGNKTTFPKLAFHDLYQIPRNFDEH